MQVRSSTQPSTEGWPTTRRYPRTTGEAFGGATYGCAVEHYKPVMRGISTVAGWLAAGVSLFVIGIVAVGR